MVSELVNFFMAPLLRINIGQLVAETIDAHDDDIAGLNRGQLAAGALATGGDIKPFYKPVTVKFRKSKGKQTDHVDLNQSGGFYRGTYAKRTAGGTEVYSSDGKTAQLARKYTMDIFGLSVASREQLADRMRPTLQDKFNQAFL